MYIYIWGSLYKASTQSSYIQGPYTYIYESYIQGLVYTIFMFMGTLCIGALHNIQVCTWTPIYRAFSMQQIVYRGVSFLGDTYVRGFLYIGDFLYRGLLSDVYININIGDFPIYVPFIYGVLYTTYIYVVDNFCSIYIFNILVIYTLYTLYTPFALYILSRPGSKLGTGRITALLC